MKLLLAACTAALITPAATQAETVEFTISGKVTGHMMPNGNQGYESNPAALRAFLAEYALGSLYSFTFSYDTASRPTNLYGRYATYSNLPIGGTFALGQASVSVPVAMTYIVGEDSMFRRERIALFGNTVGAYGRQFAGFSVLDLSFEATSAIPTGPDLPGDVTLAATRPITRGYASFARMSGRPASCSASIASRVPPRRCPNPRHGQ